MMMVMLDDDGDDDDDYGEDDDDRGMLGGSDDGLQRSEGRATVDDEHLCLRHIPLLSDPKLP